MSQSPLSPLVTVGVAGLESAINAALTLDENLKAQLASMEGKCVALACTEPDIVLTILLGEKCRILQSVKLDDPMINASLSGTPSAWFDLVRAEDSAAELINGDLQLKGDSRLFQDLGALAQNIDIDWESWLAERIGDVPTHFAARTIERTASLGQATVERINNWLVNTLQSENSPVASKAQSEELYNELRALEMRIDRLEAKLKKA